MDGWYPSRYLPHFCSMYLYGTPPLSSSCLCFPACLRKAFFNDIHKCVILPLCVLQSKGELEELGDSGDSGEYNVYSTFQSHEPDFDYLKSLEIEEKINKIRWLPQQNAAHFLLSTNGEELQLNSQMKCFNISYIFNTIDCYRLQTWATGPNELGLAQGHFDLAILSQGLYQQL